MSRAEKFISDCTRNCTNLMQVPTLDDKGNIVPEAHPWLTPDQARKAVEIAMEEVIDKTLDFLKNKLYKSGYIGIIDLCDEYIKAMKDE